MTADRETLKAAVLKVLPIDWEDRTTVVEVVPNEKRGFGANIIWGTHGLLDRALARLRWAR